MPTSPRPGPTRRNAVFGAVVILAATSGAANAQIRFGVRTGVVAASSLVRDSIVEPISVRQNAAFYLGGSVDGPLDASYRVGAALHVSRSDLDSRTPSGQSTLTTLTIWHPAVTIANQLSSWMAVEAKIGLLLYRTGRRTGTLFRDGAPAEPVIGLSIAATRRLGPRLDAAIDLGYDVHRFSTTTLRVFGFTGETTVHRVSVGLHIRASRGKADR